jgi:hypothetical protein
MPRSLNIPPDRMLVSELLRETGISRSRWWRDFRHSIAFEEQTDLRKDSEIDAYSMDRARASAWISAYKARRAAALRNPREGSERVRSLYKACRGCGHRNHSRRRLCSACGMVEWK